MLPNLSVPVTGKRSINPAVRCLLLGLPLLFTLLAGCRGEVSFVFERDIRLDPAARLSTISELRAGPDGDILVIDAMSRQAVLFDSDGTLKRMVDPSECRDDIQRRPISGDIGSRFIFLNNSDERGFVFDAEGWCLSDVDPSYQPFRHLAIISDTSLAGIRTTREGSTVFELASIEGRVIFSRELPRAPLPFADANIRGGGFAIGHDAAYFAPSVSPVLYRVSPTEVEMIDLSHLDLKTPVLDLPHSIGPNNRRLAENMASEITRNDGVFLLEDGSLFLQYFTPEVGYTRIILDPESPEEYRLSKSRLGFMEMRGGRAYHVEAPARNATGNPSIAVYRLVGEE